MYRERLPIEGDSVPRAVGSNHQTIPYLQMLCHESLQAEAMHLKVCSVRSSSEQMYMNFVYAVGGHWQPVRLVCGIDQVTKPPLDASWGTAISTILCSLRVRSSPKNRSGPIGLF